LVQAETLLPGWQLWHALFGLLAFDATVPASAMSHCVPQTPPAHTCPLPQLVPSVALVQAVELVAGWQLWQALFGSSVLAGSTRPPMLQPARQLPALQTSWVPQDVPSVTLLHAVVLVPGWQLWHALSALTVLAVTTVSPTKQPTTQLAPSQTSPVPQAVPRATFVHATVLAPGWQLWQALPGFSALGT
jgi:hypothetical protein